MDNVSAVNGLFQTVIDFGEGSFSHGTRWLEVAVCAEDCTSPDNFTLMQPRQLITPVPFAMQTRGIVVDEEGNVGIHTSEPAKELDVAGVVKTKQLHLADTNGLPLARWDGQRLEPGPTTTVSSGPPSTATSSGSPAWSNPSAVLVSDNVRATVALNQLGQGQGVLRVAGFNFNIPPDATVTSVVAFIEASGTCSCTSCSGSSSCYVTLPARLVSNGVLSSWDVGFHVNGTESVHGTGLHPDNDNEWTPAMFNSPGFGIEIAENMGVSVAATCGPPWQPYVCYVPCNSCSAAGSASIDSVVRLEITYQDPDVVVDRQWTVGLAGEQAQFLIAPTSDLSNPAMTVFTDGRVGIGVADPFYRLQLPNVPAFIQKGSAQAMGWYTYSSKRWKHNIHAIPYALEKVLKLDGVSFNWNSPEGAADIGFVAEDVAKVVPELVDMESDGINASGMKYDRVTALAVEAIKELSAQLKNREEELKNLRLEKDAQIEELRRRLDRLESAPK